MELVIVKFRYEKHEVIRMPHPHLYRIDRYFVAGAPTTKNSMSAGLFADEKGLIL
jgi:hypothetical protein